MSHGCDGFEFDVRHTRDGHNVLWHDPKFNGREIAATDFAQLRAHDGSVLACLEDVLQLFGHRAYLDIEVQVSGGEESIVAALRANPPQCGFLVSSFLPDVLLRLHEHAADLPLGYIYDRNDAARIWRELPIRAVLPRVSLATAPLIDEAHRRGMQIMTWTVNDSRRMLELAEWGIDGLISDSPELLYQTFHSK